MNYLRINQRRVKEIELPRWVNYFLQIPLYAKVNYFYERTNMFELQLNVGGPLSI
jgi:hypothetical protein